jgi:hydroxyacylglutathione hydrolase
MVGLDRVTGFITSAEGLPSLPARPFPASELPQHEGALILDVRNKTEHAEGAIPGAVQLHAGRLPWTLDELPRDREIVVHCQGGARSPGRAQQRQRGYRMRHQIEPCEWHQGRWSVENRHHRL